MSEGLFQWIGESFAKGGVIRSGAIHSYDKYHRSVAIQSFSNAIVSEVGFPTLSASSRDRWVLNIRLAPEAVRAFKGNGAVIGFTAPLAKASILASNFRFSIPGLPTSHVIQIEGFTWQQTLVAPRKGTTRTTLGGATSIVTPRLKLIIPMNDYDKWRDRWESLVISGTAGASTLPTGTLEFFSPDLTARLPRIVFYDLAPISLHLSNMDANKEMLATFQVEFQVGRMEFAR